MNEASLQLYLVDAGGDRLRLNCLQAITPFMLPPSMLSIMQCEKQQQESKQKKKKKNSKKRKPNALLPPLNFTK